MLDPSTQPRPAPRGYCRHSDATWAAARDDYSCGMSGPDVCRLHDLSLSSFRARAAKEGWRRGDLAPPPKPPSDQPAPEDADLQTDAFKLSRIAWRHAARAVIEGDRHAARTWTRLSRDLLGIHHETRADVAQLAEAVEERIESLEDQCEDVGIDPDSVISKIPQARLDRPEPLEEGDFRLARLAALTEALDAANAELDELDGSDSLFPPPESNPPPNPAALAQSPAPPL